MQRILSFSCFQSLPYSKDFVIFLFPDSFLIKGILSFPCFWLKTFKSKHLKGRSVPRVSDVFADSKDFVVSLFPDTFRNQEILSFPCFWTLSVFKGFWRFPVSRHFNFSKVSGNRKNNQILWENHYCQGILSFLLFIDTFWIQKCLETEKRPNSLKNLEKIKENYCFSCFLTLFIIECV